MFDRSEIDDLRQAYQEADTATLAALTSDIAWRIESVTTELENILRTPDGALACETLRLGEAARRSAVAEWANDPSSHQFPSDESGSRLPGADRSVLDETRAVVTELVQLTTCYDLIIQQLQSRRLLPQNLTSRPSTLDFIDWWARPGQVSSRPAPDFVR